jgi:hypothetical protein
MPKEIVLQLIAVSLQHLVQVPEVAFFRNRRTTLPHYPANDKSVKVALMTLIVNAPQRLNIMVCSPSQMASTRPALH